MKLQCPSRPSSWQREKELLLQRKTEASKHPVPKQYPHDLFQIDDRVNGSGTHQIQRETLRNDYRERIQRETGSFSASKPMDNGKPTSISLSFSAGSNSWQTITIL